MTTITYQQPAPTTPSIPMSVVPNSAPPNVPVPPPGSTFTMPTPNTDATQAAKMTPVMESLNPAQDTIQGRLPGLLDPNSDIMKQATTVAQQQMLARGLLNSSMTTGAVLDSMLKQAVPIASADAAAYQKVAGTNAAAGNTAAQVNANNEQTANADTAQAANAAALQTENINAQSEQAHQTAQDQAHNTAAQQVGQGILQTAAENAQSQQVQQQAQNTQAQTALQQQGQQILDAYDNATKIQLQQMGYTQDQMDQSMQMASDFNKLMVNAWATIVQMPNLTADARNQLLTQLQTLHQDNLDTLNQLTGINLQWSGITS